MLIGNTQGNKLTGWFLGTVVMHCPESNGMCKVFIPGVYPDNIKDDPTKIPDALQITPLFGGSVEGNGIFSYPNLGSTVLCGFLNEDQNKPFFIGSVLGGKLAQEKYLDAKPNLTKDTIKTGIDAYNHIISVDKSKIEMNEQGYIDIIAKNDENGENQVHIVCDGKGNLIISTTQQVQISSPNIKMTAGQSFELTSPQVKINATQSYELNTNTIKENVTASADRTAQDISIIGGNSVNIVTPTTNIDTSTGSTCIKGKNHIQFFG